LTLHWVQAQQATCTYQGVYGGQPAAVKVMGQASLWKPAGSYKWEHTVYQQLSELQGSCVPRVLGHGLIDFYDEYFLALELLPGTPLARLPRPLGEEVCSGARAALSRLHACGVLHGDVRLNNFMAVPTSSVGNGSRWRVVVLDFDRAYLNASAADMRKEMSELKRQLRSARSQA
jgi:tRNA A-37 threonylcarbamoyl transferase component Bud32